VPLAHSIRAALAQNSRISQQSDKTFPLRLLSTEQTEIVLEDEASIRVRYQEQADLRRRLADIGVLDQSPELPLPDRELEKWQQRVMSIYLSDTAVKLNNFEDLLRKVSFLREVVNSRFLYKTMQVEGERGLYFQTDHGLELPPGQLSSGEQHELVLLYRLLFDVPIGAIVLLDEPEISLHIAWQHKVLDDLRAISEISDQQYIVATHSPAVVGEWTERMVLLSSSDERQASNV